MDATGEADLALLIEAAREAGAIAQGFFRRDPKVWWKEGNSPVSEADFAVDRFLRDTLRTARPDYGWLSEESEAAESAADGEAPRRFFVVDPIDGTRAFLRGEDTWCVSIAVIEGERPVAGILEVPALAERFTASADGPARLGEAVLDLGGGAERPLRLALPDSVRRSLGPEALADIAVVPTVPSLAYRLALVAAGRIDGTLIRPRANDWDIAAGDLILEQAGGRLVDAEGRARLYKIEGKRHGLLIAGAPHALGRLGAFAATLGGA
ncbi:3'(2'),5'-bisphosphate nucleotidase CysQ [Mangrovibrevibacter kandeliae]|uniref:3'(2'),5'-bisphosphate nucleotidase CysQ n=1 Tax=Mangrovibrevibacter kandeliae TaxID=2968473 RepID=UPI00211794BD|nr:3'(2'),5'-bisphosphate nucleotidase CysQ [Aurantimonas sp. CSK15Z-1]MCQ8782045.1 3'(2'),5'-bisphosphate nucleotidase CysQ [Aurantimonas sp. CSK15Z-1]